jgi:tetratricopeptide (TPR) repeat protein
LTIEDLPEKVRALILAKAEGNPFFVEEILKTLVEEGDIFFSDGRWERKSAHELHTPRSVRDAVARRVERLSPEARQLIFVAAVAGYRFDFPLLQQVSQLGETELMQQLKELIGAQLVVEESLDRFAFRHALTREAIYSDTGQRLARERKAWHQIIAETLERNQSASPDAPLSDLARHFYLAGVWDKALNYSRLAGAQAQGLYAPREALDHFTRALDAAQRLSLAPPFELLHARGKTYEILGAFEQARVDLQAAIAMAQASGDGRAEWQATLDLGFLWAARDYARSGEYLLRALDRARHLGDAAIVAHTLNRVGNWHMNRDEPSEAQRYHEEALQIFQKLDDLHGVAETLQLLGVTSYVGGNILQGVAHCEQAVALFRQTGDRQGLIYSLIHLTLRAQFDTEVSDPVDLADLVGPAE